MIINYLSLNLMTLDAKQVAGQVVLHIQTRFLEFLFALDGLLLLTCAGSKFINFSNALWRSFDSAKFSVPEPVLAFNASKLSYLVSVAILFF